MIVVAGEALMDVATDDEGQRALPGGSPFNVAIGLARLGRGVTFLGAISRDLFGDELMRQLREDRVDLGLIVPTNAPTTLAIVEHDGAGNVAYRFERDGTSAATLDATALPELPSGAPVHVSFGAVTAQTRPGGAALVTLLRRERGRRFRSFDPNVRPAVITDRRAYAAQVNALVADTELVKTSDEDVAWLHPTRDPIDVARDWAAAGPSLVVLTRGARGATALRRGHPPIVVPAVPVEVADTVGAGDAFTAGLLGWLDARGRLSTHDLDAMTDDDLREALTFASRVAASTCTRTGADPPRLADLDALP